MDAGTLTQFRESLARKKEDLLEWLRQARPEEVRVRVGPAGHEQVAEHLETVESALRKAEDHRLGLCEVCHDFVETGRLSMDYTACVCLEHLTGAERARLEADLELSQKVQRALLPRDVPALSTLEVAAFSQPAHIVGGDYFDFVRLRDGAIAFVIADVMGKGMAASMLMASLQASLHIIAPDSSRPVDIAARLNHLFCHNIRLTKFVTFFIGSYDEASGRMSYCNAGHNPPLLARQGGVVEALLPTAAAIGLVERAEFGEADVFLGKGDTLLLYTDGVVESWNADKELFGQTRLEALLTESPLRGARQTIDALRSRLITFTGSAPPSDDTTVVAIRRT